MGKDAKIQPDDPEYKEIMDGRKDFKYAMLQHIVNKKNE